MANSSDIQAVDFGPFLTSQCPTTALKVTHALKQHGCVFLYNYGFDAKQIDDVMQSSKDFFDIPVEKRMLSSRRGSDPGSGYVAQGRESRNSPLVQVRQAFDFVASSKPVATIPQAAVLLEEMESMHDKCKGLSMAIFDALSYGLRLPNAVNLKNFHQKMGDLEHSSTTLRSAYYPAFQKDQYSAEHTRAAAHTDFGTLSLIFQDEVGGLEAATNGVDFVPVRPMKNHVLVLAADILQMWTAGEIQACIHQVTVQNEQTGSKSRQSVIFFVDPDYDAPVYPLRDIMPAAPTPAKLSIFKRYEEAYDPNDAFDTVFTEPTVSSVKAMA